MSPSPPPPPPPFPPLDLGNVNDIEDQRDKVAENLKSAKADAETARDSLLSGISGDDRTRALLLADAIIAGKNITRVTVTQDAVNAAIACDDFYKLMEVDRSIGFCQASIASSRRKLLADFSVSILLSTVQIDQSKIDSSVAKLPGATASRVERPEVELSNIPGIDANSDGFTRFIRLADHAVELSKQLENLEGSLNAAKTPPPPPLSSDDGMTAEDLALVITVPLVTFIFCCVLLYHRKKIADVCGGACCFWRRSRGRPSGPSDRAAQYATRTPQPPSGGTRDEPATTPDSARWASSQPSAADPWTEPEPLSPFGAAPAGFSQQPFERTSKTIDDAQHAEDASVSSDDSISSDDTDPFGAAPPATTPAAAPDPPFSDSSDDSDDDSDDDPFGDAPAQQPPVGGAQNSQQQDMDMGETLSFGDTSDGDDSASDDPFGSNKSGGDDPFADPFEDPNSP